MAEYDGLIRWVAEVHCAGCEEPTLGLARPDAELHALGWRLRNRRWHCPKCVAQIATPTPSRAEGERG